MTKIILRKVCLGLIVILTSTVATAETENDPSIVIPVNELHQSLLTIMQNAESSSFDERYKLMEKTINDTFETPIISRVILGRYWKSLDEQQQTDFINLFNRLTISTYVNRFDSYNNQSFKTLSIEPMKKNRFMVKTELISEEKTVSLNYILQNIDDQWKIISVIANGVNDLSLKRAEYSSVIKDRGYSALIASIEEKISDLHPKN